MVVKKHFVAIAFVCPLKTSIHIGPLIRFFELLRTFLHKAMCNFSETHPHFSSAHHNYIMSTPPDKRKLSLRNVSSQPFTFPNSTHDILRFIHIPLPLHNHVALTGNGMSMPPSPTIFYIHLAHSLSTNKCVIYLV